MVSESIFSPDPGRPKGRPLNASASSIRSTLTPSLSGTGLGALAREPGARVQIDPACRFSLRGASRTLRRPLMRAASALSLGPQIRESIREPREGLLENRTRRRKVETQPGVAAGPELRAGTGKDARAVFHPGVDLLRRKTGRGKI